MPDMLVPLYRSGEWKDRKAALAENGIAIRNAIAPEKAPVVKWIFERFGDRWASEAECAFSKTPTTILVAQRDSEMLGFACFDTTALGFFGPTGVDENEEGQGIGTALLIETLKAMQARGYAYGVIGGAGPVGFYERVVNAIAIPDSSPGIYADILRLPRDGG